jgi:hypothetical protein
MKPLTITLASLPDRDQLVAELWYDNELWGELSQEMGELELSIYPKPDGQVWQLRTDEVIQALQEARDKLLGPSTSPSVKVNKLQPSLVEPTWSLASA